MANYKSINKQIDVSESLSDSLSDYRNKHRILHAFRTKYKNTFEYNQIQRNAYVIQNFIKRHILFSVDNMSNEEILKINGIDRFRCIVYHIPDHFLSDFLEIMDNYEHNKITCMAETDTCIKHLLLSTLNEDKKKYIDELIKTGQIKKIYIMLNLKIHTFGTIITINDKNCYISFETQELIKTNCNKINLETITGEKFIQMLNHSKILCKYYIQKN